MNKRKLVTNREDNDMKIKLGMPDSMWGIIVSATLVALFPLAEIWSINELFNTNIPYNFNTWIAAVILSGAVSNRFLMRS